MATRTTKINKWYMKYAEQEMLIDMDDQGLFCSVPSEHHEDTMYTVRVDESGVAPVATICNCPATKPCKHMQIVDTYYKRIYKTNIFKAEQKAKAVAEAKKAAEAAKREAEAKKIITQVPTYTNMFKKPWNKIAEQREQRENYREMLAEAREIRERREMAALNGNRAFSLMR